MASRIRTVLEMIKFEHSVFALPFALTGALLAARATHARLAYAAASSLDRGGDGRGALRGDDHQPHRRPALRPGKSAHAQRALATGALSVSFAWIFTLVAVAVFSSRRGS